MTWQESRVSAAGTHHILDETPLYAERFDEVLKFHEPGLAPVRRGGEAWHILCDGVAAYDRRFDRTFGFYEGNATVIASEGWHHIRPDGTDLYAERFDWCGNFQGQRCTVREAGGDYFHITPDGKPAYAIRWRYAGDFRDSVAVAQSENGRSTHIDQHGEPMHGVDFLDLDVFHKGRARACDEDGWTHIDVTGHPLYGRRFAAVEPFYNGQARVERFDGGFEIIDETGRSVTELRPPQKSVFAELSDDLTGFWRTQTICAAVELNVIEALPATVDGVARTCGLETERAWRLLRALAELRLTMESGDEWRLTERGAYLKTSHSCTLAGAAREYGRAFSRMWEALPHALRGTGWSCPDVFGEVAADSSRVAIHHRMLMSYALHDYAAVPEALQLRGDEHVIDAGGGLGALAQLLTKEYPRLRVTILDRSEVIEQAVRHKPGNRVDLKSVDFFLPWGIEGDTVVMARVLHDWDDERALQILRHARRALPAGGRLFVVEMVRPEESVRGSLCDLHLLMMSGGRERNETDYAALFCQAGFALEGVRKMAALPSVIVAVAR